MHEKHNQVYTSACYWTSNERLQYGHNSDTTFFFFLSLKHYTSVNYRFMRIVFGFVSTNAELNKYGKAKRFCESVNLQRNINWNSTWNEKKTNEEYKKFDKSNNDNRIMESANHSIVVLNAISIELLDTKLWKEKYSALTPSLLSDAFAFSVTSKSNWKQHSFFRISWRHASSKKQLLETTISAELPTVIGLVKNHQQPQSVIACKITIINWNDCLENRQNWKTKRVNRSLRGVYAHQAMAEQHKRPLLETLCFG